MGCQTGRVLIFALDSNSGRVAARLARMSPAEIAIPSVVACELHFGTLRSADPARRQKELERLLGTISILPFDNRAAGVAAKLRYDLEQSGISIGPIDVLIAGTVLAHGAKLISQNAREFARVPGLQMDDWF